MASNPKPKAKNKSGNGAASGFNLNQPAVLMGILTLAIIGGAVAIFLSSQAPNRSSGIDYDALPQERLPDGGFVIGDPNADITVVEFADFLCPYCQTYKATVDRFVEEYVMTGQARLEYRFLPAVDRTYSAVAAQLVECAAESGEVTFWEAHDVMFAITSSQRFGPQGARTFAERVDIPYAQLLDCQSSANQVEVDSRLADRVGASGTPTVMVRYGNSEPQMTPAGQQPSFEALALIVSGAFAQ